MTSFSTLTRTLSCGLSRRHALRSVCLAATVVAGLAPATGALAQTAGYPHKPVRIIVGFPAGTGPDIVARLLAQKLSEGWGNLGVIVDNKPGAGGLVAATEAARAAPDGYTLEADGGDLIYVQNRAVRSGPPELMARLVRGEVVDPAQIYFRCSPQFEKASPALRWIGERMFTGTGARFPDAVAMRFWELM